MTHYLTVVPRDPLIARDGRPFGIGSGNRMRSLDWPYPSVVTGSLRTLLGKQAGGRFDSDTVEALKQISLAGPLPLVDHQLFLPRPLDCVVREKNGERESFGVRPVELNAKEGEGCDFPGKGLWPVLLPDDEEDFKPAKQPAFWGKDKMIEWLLNQKGRDFDAPPPKVCRESRHFLDAPLQDARFHIKMDPVTGAGRQEDAFFMTAGLDLTRKDRAMPIQLAMRVEANGRFAEVLAELDTLHPLGGERRLAQWGLYQDGVTIWECPSQIADDLKAVKRVRMVLATPAIFSGGWKPGWLKSSAHGIEGTPPGTNVSLRLKGVVIDRWQPISGWSLEKGRVGPKPIHRLVPAGGVYFFETKGDTEELGRLWLQSVSDDDQHQRDGFGLALWGVWDGHHSARKGT